MKHFGILGLSAVCAFCAAGLAAQQRPGEGGGASSGLRVSVARAQVTERALTATVGGRLSPASTVTHLASASGIVAAVDVREGQAVEVGRRLYSIVREDVAGTYMPVVVAARIAGVVSVVSVQPGQEVKTGAAGVTIIDTSGFTMTASVSDKDAFRIQTGVVVSGRAVSGEVLSGVLEVRSAEPDYKTGLYSLTFRFPSSPAAHLGQFVAVELPIATARGVFVPQSLLVRRYGRYFVWTVTDANTLKSRPVTVAASYGDMVLVEKGLESGDRYLTRVSGSEREDMPVVVMER